MAQLCGAFFHANSWEAGVKVCLQWPADHTGMAPLAFNRLDQRQRDATRRCSKSQVVVVARLQRGSAEAPPLYVARYANCYRGNTDLNVHAEEFMLTDELLEAKLAALPPPDEVVGGGGGGGTSGAGGGDGVQLLLYMTYQPCHHSGGMVSRDASLVSARATHVHQASCSERLLEYYSTKLRPRGVELTLVLADVYKATWEAESHQTEVERQVYAGKAAAAREGMFMLLEQGIAMRGMRPSDWSFLVSLCDDDVREAYAERGSARGRRRISPMHMELRARMDSYVSYFVSMGGEDEFVDEVSYFDAARGRGGGAIAGGRHVLADGGRSGGPREEMRLAVALCAAGVADVVVKILVAPARRAATEHLGIRCAKGPDGTRGFATVSRGRPLRPAPTVAPSAPAPIPQLPTAVALTVLSDADGVLQVDIGEAGAYRSGQGSGL